MTKEEQAAETAPSPANDNGRRGGERAGGLSPRTLEKMRSSGHGPCFRKHGRYVRYHIDDLDDWSLGDRKEGAVNGHASR